jgi:DNA-binding response OmpR family regulator
VDLTPVQSRMLGVLADGRPHTREELRACLWDEQGPVTNIQPHLTAIRKELRRQGEDILCVIVSRRICYRYVRLIPSPAQS